MPLKHSIVPAPEHAVPGGGDPFHLTEATRIAVEPGSDEAAAVGAYLAAILRPSTGFPLPVEPAGDGPAEGAVALRLSGDEAALGAEGYELEVDAGSAVLRAARPAGLFRGVQTIRQLLPAAVESHESAVTTGPWPIPACTIVDRPRFAWRGVMLDVARHFFTVHEVKQFIDALALYKVNTLHLHLTDDQGWRIEIASWPRLTEVGGSTQVGGGRGGFFTQRDYADIVRYAAERYITVIPEVDLPGHVNAALVAYPELNGGAPAPAPYTGVQAGFSSLRVELEATYRLVEDVVRELAAVTPGPYLHVGGDEVESLGDDAYAGFIERVQEIVARHGKRMVGWEEIAKARLLPTSVAQHWKSGSAVAALQRGAGLVLSPASRVYLDMKYDETTELGLRWAGRIEVRDAYDWDPATLLEGVAESDVLGVEAPIWAETARNMTALQYLAFPRLPAVAEVAWTPAAVRDWEQFRVRLAAQAPRWRLLGINYHRSPQVPWEG